MDSKQPFEIFEEQVSKITGVENKKRTLASCKREQANALIESCTKFASRNKSNYEKAGAIIDSIKLVGGDKENLLNMDKIKSNLASLCEASHFMEMNDENITSVSKYQKFKTNIYDVLNDLKDIKKVNEKNERISKKLAKIEKNLKNIIKVFGDLRI